MIEHSLQDEKFTLSLKPNCSASRQQVYAFIGLLAALSFLIAIVWALVGFWIVLPFAGLEVSLVGYFLIKVNYRTQQKQVLVFGDKKITLFEGHYQPERRVEFERKQTTLEVIKPSSSMQELKLALADDSNKETIAGFLVEKERNKVRKLIRQQGILETVNRWWESD
ncbi:MAG: DUF2244 domain-containing protein [Gammaproteobacteria bacterium]|nr:DUF2244 domain-containing protein [Gammaproteobacteria bacterium]